MSLDDRIEKLRNEIADAEAVAKSKKGCSSSEKSRRRRWPKWKQN